MLRKAGETARGVLSGDGDKRAWKRLSNGRGDGVGLLSRRTKRRPLAGEDSMEFWSC